MSSRALFLKTIHMVFWVLIGCLPFSGLHADSHRIVQLPAPNDGSAVVNGINANGQMIGNAYLPNQAEPVFMWDRPGSYRIIGKPGDAYKPARSFDINDLGQVVGRAQRNGRACMVLWDMAGDVWQYDLPDGVTLGDEWVKMNNNGAVCGTYKTQTGRDHGYFHDGYQFVDLHPDGPWDASTTKCINDFGEMAGSVYHHQAPVESHAAFWNSDQTFVDIHPRHYDVSSCVSLNNKGTVLLTAYNVNMSDRTTIIWDEKNGHRVIAPPDGIPSGGQPIGINDWGQILFNFINGHEFRTGIREADGTYTFLPLPDPPDPVSPLLVVGVDLNNYGEVVAIGHMHQKNYAYLWQPLRPVTMQAIVAFYDDAVAVGSLTGTGNTWVGRIKTVLMRKLLVFAGQLLAAGKDQPALCLLDKAALLCDGASNPPDFVSGAATLRLHDMIRTLSSTVK